MSDAIPQLQARLATLEQENAKLQAELATCQRSHQDQMVEVARLRASEERYQNFVADAGEGIWCFELEVPQPINLPLDEQVDHAYRYAYLAECNDVYAHMYGYEHASEIAGFRLEQIMPDTAYNREYLRSTFASDYRVVNGESHDEDRQGNVHFILNNFVGLVENGYLVRVWGTQRNITPLKQSEQALQERAAQLEATDRLLSKRDRILEATASAANALLTIKNFDEAVNTALQIIGEGVDTDRFTVIENFDHPSDPSSMWWRVLYEWASPHAISQLSHSDLAQGSYEEIEEWYELCSQGQGVSCLLEDMPEPFRSGQAELGVKAFHTVPIFVESKFWGVVGFDDCREAKRRSPVELTVLKTAAACIGSAIERERDRCTREAAERAVLLEREQTATERAKLLGTFATVANLLLRSPDYTTVLSDVVRLLGEAVGSDRCGITQEIIESNSKRPAVKILTEWCRDGILNGSTLTPELYASGVLYEEPAEFHRKLLQGEAANFLVADLPFVWHSFFGAQGNTSMLIVPIMVQGQCWGHIGFDNCGEPRLYDEAEIAILKVAADSIAAAIERQAKDDALRESEKRYRTLFELSSEGIYRVKYEQPIPVTLPIEEQVELIYRHLTFMEGNAAFAAMYGFEKPEDIVGIKLADIHVPNSEQNRSFIRSLVENGYRIRNVESEEVDRNGARRYILNNIVDTVQDEYVVGGWGMQTDITELKEAQKALLQTEQERVAELAKANDALKRSLDALATEPELEAFLGYVLRAIAEQFDSPITEYWFHPEDTAYVGLMNWQGQVLDRDAITQAFPMHLGLNGFKVPPELIGSVSPQKRKKYIVYEDHRTNPFVSCLEWVTQWLVPHGLTKEINMPMILGDTTIGALIIRLPNEHQFTSQQIELAQALAHQATLAIHLTRLAEEAKQAAVAREQEKAAQERAAELAKANDALKRGVERLVASGTIDAVLDSFLLEVIAVTDAAAGAVMRRGTGHEFIMKSLAENGVIIYPLDPHAPEELYRQRTASDTSGIMRSTAEGEVLVFPVEGIEAWFPEAAAYHNERGHRTIWHFPFQVSGEVAGYLGLAFCEECSPSLVVQETVQTLAHQVSLALEAQRLAEEAKQAAIAREQEKAAQERAAELVKANQVLKQTLNVLASEPELDQFLGQVMKAITEHLGAPSSSLWLFDWATQTASLHLVYREGQLLPATQAGYPEPTMSIPANRNDPAWNAVVFERQPFVHHVETTRGITGTQQTHLQEQGVKTLLSLPLLLDDQAIGSFNIRFSDVHTLQPEEIELAQALAHQATLAMQMTRLSEQAQETAVLEERNRMAREIHDTLAQTLAGIVVHQETAKEMLGHTPGEPEAQAYINRTLALAREGIAEARRSVWALYPGLLERADLCGALQQCIEQVTTGTALHTQFQIQGTPVPLSLQIEGNLLRIGQEAVSNVLKHSQAAQLRVELAFTPNQVRLCLRDNGQGFEPAQQTPRGFGLVSMHERAQSIGADWSVTSAPGQGTEVRVIVPLSQPIQELTASSPRKNTESLTRLLIADDHTVVRQGIAAMLEREPDLTVIAQANDGQQALELFRQHRPDVGLIDLRMPGVDGVAAITAIRAEFPEARLIVLTIYDGDEDIYRGLRAGAKGYLLKDTPRENLLECIRRVYQGQSFIPAAVGVKLAERMSSPDISDRERSVLSLMAAGKSNREIGTALCISEGTVKSHVNNILSKFQVDDRTHAVVTALKRGIISL